MIDFLFSLILIYFPASRVSPIDPARRELQNAIGEIEIGDFLFLLLFELHLVQEASLMLLDSP